MFRSSAAHPPAAGTVHCDSLEWASYFSARLTKARGFSVQEGKLQDTVKPEVSGVKALGINPHVIRSICHNLGKAHSSSAKFRSVLHIHLYSF